LARISRNVCTRLMRASEIMGKIGGETVTSTTHGVAVRERLFDVFTAHMRRTIAGWTVSAEEVEDRVAAGMVELVEVCEAALSTTLPAARIERAADFFWVYLKEFACRADLAPEGPARPP
jgi:hypothetical protein